MRFEAEGSHNGTWHRVDKAPDHWYIEYRGFAEPLRFRLALTGFKHLGLFPEQAPNWEFVYKHCEQIRKPTVLNLFAYTGGASLAAARAGAQVTHVDAVRQIVAWARDNAERNGFMDMRWLVDDVMKFVKREQRRGSKYTGIILDPPAFGHGPKGERWVLEEHLNELISILPDLLHPHGHFLLLNSYSLGYSPVILAGLLKSHFDESALKNLTCGELLIPETEGNRLLPAGVFARLHSDFAGSSHHKRT